MHSKEGAWCLQSSSPKELQLAVYSYFKARNFEVHSKNEISHLQKQNADSYQLLRAIEEVKIFCMEKWCDSGE